MTFEVKHIHQASKVSGIAIVIGALGRISKEAITWKEKLGIPGFIVSAQLSNI